MIQLLIPFSLFLTRLCFLQDLFAILCKKVLQKTDHSPLPSDIIFVNTHTNSPLFLLHFAVTYFFAEIISVYSANYRMLIYT